MYRTEDTNAGTLGMHKDPGVAADLAKIAKHPLSEGAKRAFDLLAACSLLLIFLPLFAFIALGVRASSAGPIIYSQPRVGKGGKEFRFYKFRSMVVDSDEFLTSFLDSDPAAKAQWQQYQKLDRDPRITPFGAFLRRSSLDELPQLWNVIKGDMSLVGPRPCMVAQRGLYGRYWPHYCAVRPGLTGLWQVSGRNRLTYEQRVALDADYVLRRSPWLDLRILLRTFKVVVSADGSQ